MLKEDYTLMLKEDYTLMLKEDYTHVKVNVINVTLSWWGSLVFKGHSCFL